MSNHHRIKQEAYDANLRIVDAGLVLLTWGNASVADRDAGVFAIKPSGVAYDELSAESMVIVGIESGEVVEGDFRPSSDTPTHAELYRAFEGVGAIVHTHSHFAVCYAQAARDIPVFGTTHADHFAGPVPVTRDMTQREVESDYELNTGKVIAEHFRTNGINPHDVPAVLVAHHGPFAWGPNADKAVENAIVLEEVARMGLHTRALGAGEEAPRHLVEKHFSRKHGPNAYYGQAKA
jgi:L-ribulose-5-phosphate 4-epimerase